MSGEKRFWNEAAEFMSPAALRTHQLAGLRRQATYCAARSPFYARVFREHGIDPQRIDSLETWGALPVLLDKARVRGCQEESLASDGHAFGSHLCAPLDDVVSVYSTSGTTGVPTFYCFTQPDLDVHAEMVKRVMWRTGLRRGDSILWGFGLGGFVATSLLPVMVQLGVRVIPVGAEAGTDRLVQFAGLTRPTTLIGSPSFLLHLIESVPAHTGKPVSSLGFRRLITGSEPGAGLPDVRRRILEAYDAPLYDFYGPANQFAFVACGTDDYHGMHAVGGDFGIWDQLVDPVTGEPVEMKDGAVGNMVLTEISRQAAPYLRYAMNDIIEVSLGECPCGLHGPRIRVVGRADDMLIVKGVNIFPSAVQNIVAEFVPDVTGAMRIELDRPPPLVTPPMLLKAEHGPGLSPTEIENLATRIELRVRTMLNVRPKVVLVPPGTLGRSMRKTALLYRADLAATERPA